MEPTQKHVQDEFPEGVGLKEIQKAFRTCERFENNPGVNEGVRFSFDFAFRKSLYVLNILCQFLHGQTTVIINKCVKFMSKEFLVVE